MVHIVGAINEQASQFDEQTILDTLDQPQVLQHLATFTGRPATQLFVAEHTVIKLRSDFVFQPKDVERRALAALQEERRVQVHYPAKTWFYCDWEGELVIGNIAPRLLPLHRELPMCLEQGGDGALCIFRDLIRLYVGAAFEHDSRLDEGLSNFGLDTEGRVFYLDDDLYSWDDFTSLALVLGVWIRQLEKLDTQLCRQLGVVLAETLAELAGSVHPLHILHGQLRNNLAVAERERAGIAEIMDVLSDYSRRGYKQRKLEARAEAESVAPDSTTADPLPVILTAKAAHVREPLPAITATRFAVIADIHANIAALEAVLSDIARQNIQQILVLGDVVGYGPHPEACIDLLRQHNTLVIQGNHDYAAACGDTSRGFSKLAIWSIEWTRDNIGSAYMDWLGALSPVHRQDNWIAVHGAPVDKRYFFAYVYHMTYQNNLDWLQAEKLSIGFHGHSHLQMCYQRRRCGDDKNLQLQQNLEKNMGTLACPGSVGQPRGGESRAEYAVFDSESQTLDLKRVEYDIQSTVDAMQRLQFPAQLYERLSVGA
jgi:predicted phosphodiesterase